MPSLLAQARAQRQQPRESLLAQRRRERGGRESLLARARRLRAIPQEPEPEPELAPEPLSPRAERGLPEDPGSFLRQAARGPGIVLRDIGQTALGMAPMIRDLPRTLVQASGLGGDPDVNIAVRRGFGEGARAGVRGLGETARAVGRAVTGRAPREEVAELLNVRGLTPVEGLSTAASEMALTALGGRALKAVPANLFPSNRAARLAARATEQRASQQAAREIAGDPRLAPTPSAPRPDLVSDIDEALGEALEQERRRPSIREELELALDEAPGSGRGAPVSPGQGISRGPALQPEPRPQPILPTDATSPGSRIALRGPERPSDAISSPPGPGPQVAGVLSPAPDLPPLAGVQATGRAPVPPSAASVPSGGPGSRSGISHLPLSVQRGISQDVARAGVPSFQALGQLAERLNLPLEQITRMAPERLVQLLRSESGGISPRAAATLGLGAAGAAGGAALADDPDQAIANVVLGAGAGLAAPSMVRGLRRIAPAVVPAALQARRETFLSGLALPKAVLGGIGALPIAAAETGSLRPLRQFPSMMADIGRSVVSPTAAARRRPPLPLETGQQVSSGPFSSRIGAVDAAVQAALRRGVPGITQPQINRALVRTPLEQNVGARSLELLRTPGGKFTAPFQTTPFDIGVGGFDETLEMLGPAVQGAMRRREPLGALGTRGRRRALTAGTAAAGLAAGETLGDEDLGFLKASLIAAALGRRAVPFSAAAALTGGPQFLRGVSPVPELDLKNMVPTSLEDVSFIRLMQRLSEGQ